jgi:putative radical SAM enzyme (TIGR03279 family)
VVAGVVPGSIAEEVGLAAGDELLAVNGVAVRDILAYRFHAAEERVVLEVRKASGERWSVEIEKDVDEDLGLQFGDAIFDSLRVCRFLCLFCFVFQLPPGVRPALRVKDDDFRHSFLHGNFITLTNLDAQDWEEIVSLHLSPLYVSVHSTEAAVRARLLGTEPALAEVMGPLRRLGEAGITVHAQVVLCPGINDGPALERTVADLASLWPTVRSIGVVPVGLTAFRRGLPSLLPVDAAVASAVVGQAQEWQRRYRGELGVGLVYLADELYLKAGQEFPPAASYDGYPQLENGIGLAREFLDGVAEQVGLLAEQGCRSDRVVVACGEAAGPVLQQALAMVQKAVAVAVELLPVPNRFFDGGVTVTGLVTGGDLLQALGHAREGATVLVPDVMLREGDAVFLDDLTLEAVARGSGTRLQVVETSARGLLQGLCPGLQGGEGG